MKLIILQFSIFVTKGVKICILAQNDQYFYEFTKQIR
jgi:hypothetical protein